VKPSTFSPGFATHAGFGFDRYQFVLKVDTEKTEPFAAWPKPNNEVRERHVWNIFFTIINTFLFKKYKINA
jgi:hypothetical protein